MIDDPDPDPVPRAEPVEVRKAQPVDPDTPDDPNIPKDVREDPKSPFGKEAPKTDEDIAQEHVQEQKKILEEAQERMKQWENNYNQSVKDMQKSWAEPDTAPPQPIPLPQRPMQERQGWSFLQMLIPMVALGIGIAGSRGKFGGGTPLLNFWGSMLHAYSQGRNQESRRKEQDWWKQVEFTKAENSERLANYRAQLQDERSSLQQKMDNMRIMAQQHGWARMEVAAANHDLQAVEKELKTAQKANQKYSEYMYKAGTIAGMLRGKDPYFKQWIDRLSAMHHERTGIWPSQTSELDEESKALPYEKFMEGRKEEGKIDPKTGKPMGIGGPEEKKKGGLDSPEAHKAFDELFGTPQTQAAPAPSPAYPATHSVCWYAGAVPNPTPEYVGQ